MKKSEQSLKPLWGTNKWMNICIEGIQEREERILKEIMAKKLLNLMKDMTKNISKDPQTPNRINSKPFAPKHIVIEKVLKAMREE